MQVKRITLCPNVTFDFFHFQKQDDSNANIFVNNYKPVVSTSSISLICFDDSMQNIYNSYGTTDTSLGYNFSVYKETNNNDALTFVANVSSGALSIIDHNIKNNSYYKYYIYKEDADYSSAANITNQVYTNWDSWSITQFYKENEADSSNVYSAAGWPVYKLSLNLESGEISQTYNKTLYDSLSQYPKISTGINNYAKGSITAILGYISDDKYNDYNWDGWDRFCASGQLKILKDRKGNAWIVSIQDMSKKIADESNEQYCTVTFNWVEVMPTSGISIVE